MLEPYRMLLVVQNSCLYFIMMHLVLTGMSVSVASSSIGSAIFDKGMVASTVVCYGIGIS